jgi:pimeloyl-ACP methyl ester carboxylesterase
MTSLHTNARASTARRSMTMIAAGGRTDRAVSQLYGRVDPQLAERLATHLRPQPQTVFRIPYPLERPPDVPSAFLYAREDELFNDSWSRWIARTLLGTDPVELPGGHFPMLEQPSLLADIL